MGFDKGLVSTKIDVWLNGQAFDPVFKWYLNDLKINLPNEKQSIRSGSAHPITRYVSWVQNDVNQFGLYL